jgi:hypothetical protein
MPDGAALTHILIAACARAYLTKGLFGLKIGRYGIRYTSLKNLFSSIK